MSEKRQLLCHYLASIAYHLQKALRDAPEGFETFRPGPRSRTPQELVCHMECVLGYARTFFLGGTYRNHLLPSMKQQVQQLHQTLQDLIDLLDKGQMLREISEEQLLQGPLSDAMTHIGQISYLRRLFGSPVPSENFIYATIGKGNVSADQALPNRPDTDWSP
jgi:hypothetical protein